ncbi:unnamed protein product [Clonostachys rosea f. rosea IK726]|uniref:Uncharacterized protein n=1 Tax=Clonostachys rosea f. rosea IK726 TaxID=1349383 RepID=A0ACA9ULA8_BIOOC|nr:unnamed protein product [Clonostachys rosea f. rosea IK726]
MLSMVSINRHQTSVIPGELTETCDKLQRVIMDLRSRFEAQKTLSDETPSSKIIRKTTVAFQNALIIYFAQHIRLLGHRYLEPYVQAVLASIKEIEMIKAEKQILAAPLYWPAFIAGSEAFDDLIQTQFKDWYKRVEVYGIESARTGILVVEKIWMDGPGTGTRLTSQWMATVERMGVDLMLS